MSGNLCQTALCFSGCKGVRTRIQPALTTAYLRGGMKRHSKNARGSTWDKHTNQDKGRGQKKVKGEGWVDMGPRTNSDRNQQRKQKNNDNSGGGGNKNNQGKSGGEGNKKKSGCFITTATCSSLGKSDDCAELQAFRRFRDGWLEYQPDGPGLIQQYYETAPHIVECIDELPDSESVYASIWRDHLASCLIEIRAGNFEQAKAGYLAMVTALENRFLTPVLK